MYYPLKIANMAQEETPEKLLEYIKSRGHCDEDATVEDLYDYAFSYEFFKPGYIGKFDKYNDYIMHDRDINKIFFPMFKMSQIEERSTEWKDVTTTNLVVNLWRNYKMVYKIDNEFFHEIKQTKDLITTYDMFEKLPFKCFYIDLSDVKNISDFNGAWVYVVKDNKREDFIGVNIYMISEYADTFYTYYSWYNFKAQPEVKWNIKDLPESEFVRRDIREEIEGITEDTTVLRQDYDPRDDIVVAIFQIMSFIAIDANDVSENPITKKTYKKHSKSEIKDTFSEVKMYDVGIRYGKAIKVAKQEYKKQIKRNYNITKERKPVRPHVRRAHWQRYHIGKGRTDIKTKWIAPVYVCGNGKEIPVTIREIKK